MNNEAWSARLTRMSLARAFATVFAAVCLLIFLGSAAVTFMLPEWYCAVARVAAPRGADWQLLQATELLNRVAEQPHLPEALAARYGDSKPWENARVEEMLRRSVQLRRVPRTDLMEIRVYGLSPGEAAEWANAVAAQAGQTSGSLRIIDKAVPPLRPVRPNKPLNLALGAVMGTLLGLMAGGVGAKLAVGFKGGSGQQPGPG